MRASATRLLAATVVALGAGVLATHALVGVRTTGSWFSGDRGGLADLAWQQSECLARAVEDLAPEGTAVHVPAEIGPLSQRLVEAAYRRGPVVASPEQADVIVVLVDTPGAGCQGVTPSTLPVPGRTA